MYIDGQQVGIIQIKEKPAVAEANKWKLIDNRSLPKVNNNKIYFC